MSFPQQENKLFEKYLQLRSLSYVTGFNIEYHRVRLSRLSFLGTLNSHIKMDFT